MRVLTSAQVEVPLALGHPLDYAVDPDHPPELGSVVRVSVGNRTLPGVVMSIAPYDGERSLKPLGATLASALSPKLIELARFVADYYQVTLGVALGLLVPPGPAPAAAIRGWRLTEAGRQQLDQAPRRRKLARRLREAFAGVDWLSAEAAAALGEGARRQLREWSVLGWVQPVLAEEAGLSTAERGRLVLPELRPQQRAALEALRETVATRRTALLHGVTGSGKTEVVLALAAERISAGQQVLLLVPEINLTPQLVERVERTLPGARVALMHSRLAAGARARAWHEAHQGMADLVIGTRLAVFSSLPRLGLIVIDEEHEGSYKQDDSPRYHARDVAVMRGHLEGVPVILASATPSLESWRNMRLGRYDYVTLTERATAAPLPRIRFLPAHGQRTQSKGGLAPGLIEALRQTLARGEQCLVLVNRRGYAPALYCPHCGWVAPCRRCDAKLTWHQIDGRLRCHHCGWDESPPEHCRACGHRELVAVGVGTQRIEAALRELLPGARIARADSDSMGSQHAWAALYRRMRAREIDVLVGTQMLAKGHDFPALTLVGVIGCDRALFSTDFRAQEELLALLTQVAGRAGRHERPGEVIVQTDFPEHEVFQTLRSGNYAEFADRTLERRRSLGLPPATRMALVRAEAKRAELVEQFFAYAYGIVRAALADGEVYPPQAAPLSRKADHVRWMMAVVAPKSRILQQALAALAQALRANRPRLKWVIDVDPYDFS
ncbi:MAG: primosomal protein N' [Casimicrobiaceae bacterium]|nr:primosomal protein N' [Casimicrobiaceae bacterium]MDW8312761.1 primosomal protein N' [Burkholderiales bacterium]